MHHQENIQLEAVYKVIGRIDSACHAHAMEKRYRSRVGVQLCLNRRCEVKKARCIMVNGRNFDYLSDPEVFSRLVIKIGKSLFT